MRFRNLPEHLKEENRIFEGKKFDLYVQEYVKDNGQAHKIEVIVHPGSVVILPILSDDKIVMIQNYRRTIGKKLWELPAGTLEMDESPLITASRELIEETGYQANSIKPLISFYTSPGICTEMMHIFLAQNLTHVGQNLNDNEEIEIETIPLTKTLEMVKNNEIMDGKTIATLLYYSAFIQKS